MSLEDLIITMYRCIKEYTKLTENMQTFNPWFFPLTPNIQSAKLRLFTFHYAGGSASIFRPWVQDINSSIEIISIQLPGRETRFTETPFYDLKSLIEDLLKNFPIYFDKPFIFFGHSIGSFISFEFARILRRKKYPLPQHLIISGARAPHLPLRRKKLHNLPEKEFVSELFSYNGIPSALLEDKDILNLFIPMIRADFTVSETYHYIEEDSLKCPISAFGGTEDPYVSREEISSWQSHTTAAFNPYFFKGDHFFFTKDSYQEVVHTVGKIIFDEI